MQIKKILVTQTKSAIRRPGWQNKVLLGLGLKKLHKGRLLDDSDSIRGMINKVKHLVTFETIS